MSVLVIGTAPAFAQFELDLPDTAAVDSLAETIPSELQGAAAAMTAGDISDEELADIRRLFDEYGEKHDGHAD